MIELINMFVNVGTISYNDNGYIFYNTESYYTYGGYVYICIIECYYRYSISSIGVLSNNEDYKNLII